MKPFSHFVFFLLLCSAITAQAQQRPTTITGTFKEILPHLIKGAHTEFEGMYYLDTNDYSNKLAVEIKDPVQKEQFKMVTGDGGRSVYIREQFKTLAAAKAKREVWKKALMEAWAGCDFIELANFPEPYYMFKHPALEFWNISMDVLERRDMDAKGKMITTYSAGFLIDPSHDPWPGDIKPLNAFQQMARTVTMQFNHYGELQTTLEKGVTGWMANHKMQADINNISDPMKMETWMYTAVWNTITQEAADAKWKTLSEELTEALQSFMKKEDCSSDGSKCLKFTRKEEVEGMHLTVVTIEQVVDADRNQVNVYFMVR